MIIAFFATTRCVDGACYPNQLCSSPPALQTLSEEFLPRARLLRLPTVGTVTNYNRQINTGTSTYPFLQTPSLAPAAPLRSTPGIARRSSGPGSAPEPYEVGQNPRKVMLNHPARSALRKRCTRAPFSRSVDVRTDARHCKRSHRVAPSVTESLRRSQRLPQRA